MGNVANRISEHMEKLLTDMYAELDITVGDVTPSQAMAWDNVCGDMAKLFQMLIEQNLHATLVDDCVKNILKED